jgi:3-deoxy-D-manno-octulosonic-acid transferase
VVSAKLPRVYPRSSSQLPSLVILPFAEATHLSTKRGATLQVKDASELIDEMQRLLGDPGALYGMRQHCLDFVGLNRGATDNALQLIRALLSAKTIV